MFQMLLNISFYNLHNTKGRSLIAKKKKQKTEREERAPEQWYTQSQEGKSNNVNIFKMIEISEV